MLLSVGLILVNKGRGDSLTILVIYVLGFMTVVGLGYFGGRIVYEGREGGRSGAAASPLRRVGARLAGASRPPELYLLDLNDPENPPIVRGITNELYGGGVEMRITQEIVLGIGGWRLLRTLGINPEVCHLNEGHAAFAILERAADFRRETGQPFEVALQVTRAGNLFTTHTPVAAGFDRFPPDLVRQHLGNYAESHLGLSFRDLMAMGRQNPDNDQEPFNMAYLAVRGSGAVNGVSQLHGEVSRGYRGHEPGDAQDLPLGCGPLAPDFPGPHGLFAPGSPDRGNSSIESLVLKEGIILKVRQQCGGSPSARAWGSLPARG